MNQHSGLTAERWRGFSEAQRILMIGNEMNRAAFRILLQHTPTSAAQVVALGL